ncbi:MAG: alpha/beta fold hydrolase [Aquihabitans sp.]
MRSGVCDPQAKEGSDGSERAGFGRAAGPGDRLAQRRVGSAAAGAERLRRTSADWDPTFIGALADHFEVVLPDNRGMGASTWGDDDEPLSIASMADDALALADALSLGSFPLIGWSMGGFIAQTLVSRAPERVTGLALLGTNGGSPGAVVADDEVWADLTDLTGSDREQATRLLSVLFPPEVAAELDAQVGPLVAEARASLDHRALQAQEAAMADWLAADLVPIPTPPPRTLVACGALDQVIPPANAAILAQRWGATMPITYEGCGHAFMAQVPVDLASHLIAHLA